MKKHVKHCGSLRRIRVTITCHEFAVIGWLFVYSWIMRIWLKLYRGMSSNVPIVYVHSSCHLYHTMSARPPLATY